MKNIPAIETIPGLGSGERPKLDTFDDIRKVVAKTPKHDITPARSIDLGTCGMGMPVLQSKWALNEMKPYEVLETRSGHP